jgi:ribonucleotide reductase alpha subunit
MINTPTNTQASRGNTRLSHSHPQTQVRYNEDSTLSKELTMTPEQELTSQVTVFSKYARYWGELGRRETHEEIVARNRQMHIDHLQNMGKLTPEIMSLIDEAYRLVADRKVFPSMRSFQFGGEPIHIANNRIYNCAFRFADEPSFFPELMFLLMGGTGVGYSVQKHHVNKLPTIKHNTHRYRYEIADSIEGWADAIKVLVDAYFNGTPVPIFDYSLIRPEGAILKTSGGRAPGPDPLRKTLEDIQAIFETKVNDEKLKPIEVHDIATIIARAVLSGGIRRSAMISLFSPDDEEMLTCKMGEWWNVQPARAYSNNSAVLLRGRDDELFFDVFQRAQDSGSGEPGIFWTDDERYGTNPCKPLRSLILTTDGYITFEQALKRDSLEVVLSDGSVAKASKPFKTGDNRVVTRFALSNGQFLYGTENHLHMTREGEWKRMDEIKIGDQLAFSATKIHNTAFTNKQDYESGILAGWLHADGWWGHGKAGLSVGVNEFDVIPLLERITNATAKPHTQKPDTCKVLNIGVDAVPEGVSQDKEDLTWLYEMNKDFKLGFIRAAFTADGSVRKANNVELYSIRRPVLEVISNILREFGIYSTVCIHNYAKSYVANDGKERNNKDTWKLNVYAGQFQNIGFLSEFKQALLNEQVEKPIYRYADYVTIIDIDREYSVEDVYDITVDHPEHYFLDSGVVTHNCAEITLNNKQVCNLTTINAGTITNQEDFNKRARAAGIIGTLQASYTNFHYLSEGWREQTEAEALLGVSMTGIASGAIVNLDATEAAAHAVAANHHVSELIGINKAARVTSVKPEGTASLVAGTSSGIHAWHDKIYVRRMRYNKSEPIAKYLMSKFEVVENPTDDYPHVVEQDVFNPHQIILAIPQRAPEGAATREEGAMRILERVKRYNRQWIRPGNEYGGMTNNISATINIQPHEWEMVRDWMWNNRYEYNGLSILPYSDHTYRQAPYQTIDEITFNRLASQIQQAKINLTEINESEDYTTLSGEMACVGGACELPW